MEGTPGWDARFLNEEMLEMVRREYPETAERIETKPYYKWQEENKQVLSFLGQVAMEIAYGCMFYECMIAEKPYLERIERQRAYNTVEEPANANEEVGSDVGGSENGTDTNTFKAPEIKVNAKGELTNGQYTLNEADMQVHVNGRNPGKSRFLYDVDANKAVLDAAAYADMNDLWEASSGNLTDFANKAKVYVENGSVGVTGNGQLTNYINVYRTKTGYVHGCPGNP